MQLLWRRGRVAGLLAAEAHSKGVAVVLAPMMNLQRLWLGPRFECFSEDPLLSDRIGAELVRGLQRMISTSESRSFVPTVGLSDSSAAGEGCHGSLRAQS